MSPMKKPVNICRSLVSDGIAHWILKNRAAGMYLKPIINKGGKPWRDVQEHAVWTFITRGGMVETI